MTVAMLMVATLQPGTVDVWRDGLVSVDSNLRKKSCQLTDMKDHNTIVAPLHTYLQTQKRARVLHSFFIVYTVYSLFNFLHLGS